MSEVELFSAALNIADPWYISDISFFKEERRLDITVEYNPNSSFDCPECKSKTSSIHDVSTKVWRHLNFSQYKCYIHCETPRVYCKKCGLIRSVSVPWSRNHSGFTLLMEECILYLSKSMPISGVAAFIDETGKRVWRVVKHWKRLIFSVMASLPRTLMYTITPHP